MQRDFSDIAAKSENLGIRVVGFLLSQPADFALLLASTGLTYEDFKRTPYGQDQLLAALEFLVTNETMLLRFARATGWSPEAVYEAWRVVSKPSWAHQIRPGMEIRPWRAISSA